METKLLSWITVLILRALQGLALPTLLNNVDSLPTLETLHLSNETISPSNGSSSPNPSAIGIPFRVDRTPITLRFVLYSAPTIAPGDMQITILNTQVKLRRFIATHWHSVSDVLFYSDDPYMSDPVYQGCFFAVTHWPPTQQKRLTYGMVDDALKGVWEFLYRGGRFVKADFYVDHDTLGAVGYGWVGKDRPRTVKGIVTEM